MKLTLTTLLAVSMLGMPGMSQSPRPLPSSMRHAQELEAQNEKVVARGPVDPLTLRREANQLADLAASIPKDVQNLSKGLLSKDLLEKLKQIEKMSKHLRRELDR